MEKLTKEQHALAVRLNETSREIAASLGIGVSAVDKRIRKIAKALGVVTREEILTACGIEVNERTRLHVNETTQRYLIHAFSDSGVARVVSSAITAVEAREECREIRKRTRYHAYFSLEWRIVGDHRGLTGDAVGYAEVYADKLQRKVSEKIGRRPWPGLARNAERAV